MVNIGEQQQVCNIFNQLNPDRLLIIRSTVSKIVLKFNETGSINGKLRHGQKTSTTEDKARDVLLSTYENHHSITRQIAMEQGICHV